MMLFQIKKQTAATGEGVDNLGYAKSGEAKPYKLGSTHEEGGEFYIK
jgi:hypothetical protein